ncbi:glycosyltransferase [Paenibacillus sp. GCM10012307]|uniref:Glycosyltransferase n=1 Tax=Paenibacillus roseus TaxID=2798579 RepID=A0A934J9A8_9BACL|nr:glycosyltransferase [Paenibacillus roseus]MBJ6362720.1 glycosyltransferase [Paenibacillus roseus]
MTFISEELAARFHRFGSNTFVQEGGQFVYPEDVSIGSNVFIRAHYWFNVISPGLGASPKIIIGDGTQCNLGLVISAVNQVEFKANVLTGPNVYISDTDHQYREVGIPIHSQGITSYSNRVEIGEGAWIGANAVIVGHVKIGKGSVISANSVVTGDVPDYCVVGGSPAKILRVYDPGSGQWLRTRSKREAGRILERRKEQPLLSICIPTYNRARDLEQCLASIYSQIGDTDLVEVRVSDNASDDETPEVLKRYAEQYPGLHYERNAENIGADPNILHVVGQGKGKFLKIQGDDDFYVQGTLIPLLHVLHTYKNCSVIHIDLLQPTGLVEADEGLEAFLHKSSIYSSFISATILRREDWEQIEDKSLYLDSSFNQIYWQYAMLERNPKFCVVHRSMFTYAGNDTASYNFGKVFIDSYQRILQHFAGRGLSEDGIRADKQRVFYSFILPWFQRFAASGSGKLEGFESYFNEHYGSEPYYLEALEQIHRITSRHASS